MCENELVDEQNKKFKDGVSTLIFSSDARGLSGHRSLSADTRLKRAIGDRPINLKFIGADTVTQKRLFFSL